MTKNLFFDEPEPKTKVLVCFREWMDEITAVFISDEMPMECYAHIGQHSNCDQGWVRKTKPADPLDKRVSDLMAELESIGYEIEVAKKMRYPDPTKITCPKCGVRYSFNESEYNLWCRDENRNLRQSFTSGGLPLKRLSLREWAERNHVCKPIKKKKK